jgi:hypothetical protein
VGTLILFCPQIANPQILGLFSAIANPQVSEVCQSKSEIRKFLGFFSQSLLHKFLRCASPQIANQQILGLFSAIANPQISEVCPSANRKSANLQGKNSVSDDLALVCLKKKFLP